MRLSCTCLNFSIEIENLLDLEIVQLDLISAEKEHPYFIKDVYRMGGKINKKIEVYPNLTKSEIVGSWNIRQCLVCKMYTHATNYVNGLSTCSTLLQELTDLKNVERDGTMCFSRVFQICFPKILDISVNTLLPIPGSEILDYRDIELLDKKAKTFIEMSEQKIKDSSMNQSEDLENLTRRIYSERYHLLQMFIKAKEDILKTSPFIESVEQQLSSSDHVDKSTLEGSEQLLSHNEQILDTQDPEIEKELQRLQISSEKPLDEQQYSDNEGIFDMDDVAPLQRTKSDPPPYIQDEFSDDNNEDFYREMRHLPREVARSAPLDCPPWPLNFPRQREGDDEKVPKNPEEIAASIKEMARNIRVSSVDVFGDLPRHQLPKDSDTYLIP